MYRIWFVGCAAVCMAMAREGSVSGPGSGFVFDRSGSALRPVLGIPGASVLGDPLKLGFDLSSATVAPAQDSVLAIAADGGSHFLRLSADGAAERGVKHVDLLRLPVRTGNNDGIAPARDPRRRGLNANTFF